MVPRDAQQPRDDRRAPGHVPRRVVDHGEEDLLRHIFRRRRDARHVQGKAVNIGPAAPIEPPNASRSPAATAAISSSSDWFIALAAY